MSTQRRAGLLQVSKGCWDWSDNLMTEGGEPFQLKGEGSEAAHLSDTCSSAALI